MVIAFFVFMESVARLVDPPDIDTNMLTVSLLHMKAVLQLIVFLFWSLKKEERLKLHAQEIRTVSCLFNR